MIPSLIVHCVNEVELRGLTEIGIYRVPGSEKDVKSLKVTIFYFIGVDLKFCTTVLQFQIRRDRQ